jgi:nucleotidyltransferase/DNA polymerase involved in DNA repair
MSYVCLWSPSWPTGADFPADLAASLLTVAPRVAIGERALVWGDARGLHGGQLAERMLHVASDYGYDDVHAGVAMTPVAAEVAATQNESRLIIVTPGTDANFIKPYKLSVLSPSEQLAALLQGLGIETCGALGSLDAESIEVRLGVEGVRFWQRARAEEARWLFKTPPRELPSAAMEWVEYGLKDPERLLFVINSLAGTVCTALTARGEKAREISLVFALGNRTQRSHLIRSSRPSAEQKRWMRLVREALDTITLPDAVMGVTLRVESAVGSHGAQGDLFDRGFASAPAVEEAVVQLTDDQGDVVVQPVNDQHPLLEMRTQWKSRRPGALASGKRSFAAPRSAQDDKNSLTLQLLPTPKVVTVDTEPRRDHEVPTRYLDGNEWHDLVEVAGPDRVSGGQWNAAYAREYFRCVREDGMMVWLFRGAKQQTSDWFLHGWWD